MERAMAAEIACDDACKDFVALLAQGVFTRSPPRVLLGHVVRARRAACA